MKFIRFTPAHQPGDVFVRNDAVTSVQPNVYSGALFSGEPLETPTAINTTGGGTVIVKESPSQVIEALRAAENTHYVTVEYVMEDGDTSSLADDCDNALALKEAQADAKIADERAEWYKRRAETGDTLLEQGLVEFDKLKADRDRAQRDAAYYKQIADSRMDTLSEKHIEIHRITVERDQLLAKLKDTTAALEKANAELAAIPHDANAAHNAFINSIKSAMGQSGLYQYTRT